VNVRKDYAVAEKMQHNFVAVITNEMPFGTEQVIVYKIWV